MEKYNWEAGVRMAQIREVGPREILVAPNEISKPTEQIVRERKDLLEKWVRGRLGLVPEMKDVV